MEVADMRRLLNESKSSGKPLGCAVGMSKDMKTALLLLHKTHEGPELGRTLKKDVPDIVNMRFGTARIDEENTKMVRLVLNRPVTGVAKKLIKTLKGTGYTKVKLGLEDGTEFEGADDEEDAQAQAAKQAAPAAEAPSAAASPAAPPPPPAPEPAEAPPDADALKKELAALAAQIASAAAGDPAKTAALVKLAREGQVNIATNNLKYAATSIEQLRRALAAPAAAQPQAAAAAPPPPPPPPPAAEAAKPDPLELRKQLEALAKRIPEAAAGDAKRNSELVKLAREVQTNIATNNLAYATTSLAQLRTAIEGKAAPQAPAAPEDPQKTLNFLQRLKLLILKAANGDAALQAQWMAMADAAEAELSGGNAAAGAAGVEALRVAMLPAVTRMQDEAKASGAYTSSGKKWLEMRQTVEDEMERLRLSIVGAYENDPALPAIEKAFRDRTAPVLRTLDASLATKLEAAGKATKPEERQKLVDEAHGILDGYRKYAADPFLADLDNNPFVPLSLQASLTATLSELASAIH